MLSALAALALVGLAVAAPVSDFAAWKNRNGKTYSGAEHARRELFFAANAAEIAARDAASPLASYAPDLFADRSPKELAGMRGLTEDAVAFADAEAQPPFTDGAVAAAAAAGAIDWVAKGNYTSNPSVARGVQVFPPDRLLVVPGAVNKPISQGRCGTCAQFSATANIEAQWHLAGHPLVYLATQEMVDCSSYTGPCQLRGRIES